MDARAYQMYLGKGGQLAVMSHIVTRGLNVAIPEIDIGSDIFVVHDEGLNLWTVQVKTSTASRNRDGSFSAKFYLSQAQVRTALPVKKLVFSLVFFDGGRYLSFVNVPREALDAATAGMQPTKGAITPTLRLTATAVLCGSVDLQPYRDNWDHWPDLRPRPPRRGRPVTN